MLAKTAQCCKNCSWAKFKVGQHGYASVSSVASQTMQPGFCLWICQLLFQKTGVLHFLVPDHALLSCLDSASSDPQQGGATFTVDHLAASQHHILPDALYCFSSSLYSLVSSGLPQMQATSTACSRVSVASLCWYIETVFARAAS